jgi:hypothetical protein
MRQHKREDNVYSMMFVYIDFACKFYGIFWEVGSSTWLSTFGRSFMSS